MVALEHQYTSYTNHEFKWRGYYAVECVYGASLTFLHLFTWTRFPSQSEDPHLPHMDKMIDFLLILRVGSLAGHGGFKFRHPWTQRCTAIGTLTRQCACRIEALNNYINSPIRPNNKLGINLEDGNGLQEDFKDLIDLKDMVMHDSISERDNLPTLDRTKSDNMSSSSIPDNLIRTFSPRPAPLTLFSSQCTEITYTWTCKLSTRNLQE
ncbi:hypothetical protein Syun_026709 [Stephania yunnanensis]|uniref:Uncharacterized protein n=1 Tax=Stephania yunnanensis TaxID=152371 RepID=A0AAP0HKD0_9MAGN